MKHLYGNIESAVARYIDMPGKKQLQTKKSKKSTKKKKKNSSNVYIVKII